MRKIIIIFFVISGCYKPKEYEKMPWKVGQWVHYKINQEPISISIVDKDLHLFWIEIEEPEIIIKMLVEETKINNPKRIIIKKIGEKPMEFKNSDLYIKNKIEIVENIKNTDRKVIITPGGRFYAFYINKNNTELWLSDEIPILGIVKYKSKGTNMVLYNYGLKGATSKIKEEPVELFNLL